MRTATTIFQWLARMTGLTQIILGLLFWIGYARALIPLHMLIGLVLVLALFVLAILAAFAGVSRMLVVLAVVWSLVVPIFGVTQTQLLPGAWHWVIQVLHLLVGLAAIRLAGELAWRMMGWQPFGRGRQQAISMEEK